MIIKTEITGGNVFIHESTILRNLFRISWNNDKNRILVVNILTEISLRPDYVGWVFTQKKIPFIFVLIFVLVFVSIVEKSVVKTDLEYLSPFFS